MGPCSSARPTAVCLLALASHTNAFDPNTLELNCKREIGATWATERCELHVQLGEASVLHRVVGIYSSRDDPDPIGRAEALEDELAHTPCAGLLADHAAAWRLGGNTPMSKWTGPRRSIARFVWLVSPAQRRASERFAYVGRCARLVGRRRIADTSFGTPRSLCCRFTCTRGHKPPERFCAIAIERWMEHVAKRNISLPRRALRLGISRYGRRDDSRNSAHTVRRKSFPSFRASKSTTSARTLHTPSGPTCEQRTTSSFYARKAQKYSIETARFWSSRVKAKNDGYFHIDRVIGPDEYHESIDDNAFTNWMARKNLRIAANVARGEGQAVAFALGVDARNRPLGTCRGTYVPRSGRTHAHHRTTPRVFPTGTRRPRGLRPAHRSDGTFCSDASERKLRKWSNKPTWCTLIACSGTRSIHACGAKASNYYEPRTAHGSSLSPGIHALVAARLGLTDLAARYLEQTADIDLGNNMGNAAGGVHAAAMGSLWQAVVFGVAGLRQDLDDPDRSDCRTKPFAGHATRVVALHHPRQNLELHVCRHAIEVSIEDGLAPIDIAVPGPAGRRERVRAEPGRAYVADMPKTVFPRGRRHRHDTVRSRGDAF